MGTQTCYPIYRVEKEETLHSPQPAPARYTPAAYTYALKLYLEAPILNGITPVYFQEFR